MDDVRIVWSCDGFAVLGTTAGALGTALRALGFGERGVVSEKPGAVIELLAVELRALGAHVTIAIKEGHVLHHRGCVQTYGNAEWNALEVAVVKIVSRGNGTPVEMPSRRCRCGEFVGYDSLEVVHAQDVCNARGGSA